MQWGIFEPRLDCGIKRTANVNHYNITIKKSISQCNFLTCSLSNKQLLQGPQRENSLQSAQLKGCSFVIAVVILFFVYILTMLPFHGEL